MHVFDYVYPMPKLFVHPFCTTTNEHEFLPMIREYFHQCPAQIHNCKCTSISIYWNVHIDRIVLSFHHTPFSLSPNAMQLLLNGRQPTGLYVLVDVPPVNISWTDTRCAVTYINIPHPQIWSIFGTNNCQILVVRWPTEICCTIIVSIQCTTFAKCFCQLKLM